MRTKEEYYEDTLKNRALLESQEVLNCSCPYRRCEWHGKCRECVALHRYHAEHLPCCLQPLLREKITVWISAEKQMRKRYMRMKPMIMQMKNCWRFLKVYLGNPTVNNK